MGELSYQVRVRYLTVYVETAGRVPILPQAVQLSMAEDLYLAYVAMARLQGVSVEHLLGSHLERALRAQPVEKENAMPKTNRRKALQLTYTLAVSDISLGVEYVISYDPAASLSEYPAVNVTKKHVAGAAGSPTMSTQDWQYIIMTLLRRGIRGIEEDESASGPGRP